MQTLTQAAAAIQVFQKDDLGERIATIESLLKDSDSTRLQAALSLLDIDNTILDAALTLKVAAAQVNVIMHAVGILLAAPKILDPGERIVSLSLGAGNTGKPFDLETTQRVAEFKFIQWKGGAEAIRQNSLFKDFYLLAEYPSEKTKELYAIGKKHALKFLQGGRALRSVMSHQNKLWAGFQERYPSGFTVVSDYYTFRKREVILKDLVPFLPALGSQPTAEDLDEAD